MPPTAIVRNVKGGKSCRITAVQRVNPADAPSMTVERRFVSIDPSSVNIAPSLVGIEPSFMRIDLLFVNIDPLFVGIVPTFVSIESPSPCAPKP